MTFRTIVIAAIAAIVLIATVTTVAMADDPTDPFRAIWNAITQLRATTEDHEERIVVLEITPTPIPPYKPTPRPPYQQSGTGNFADILDLHNSYILSATSEGPMKITLHDYNNKILRITDGPGPQDISKPVHISTGNTGFLCTCILQIITDGAWTITIARQ